MIYVLSGGEKLRSVIAVTYPEGSICTCSNGTKTLKARDTSGKALFNVTVGEWTVSCTDGTDTDSKTVSITAEGQGENVELAYKLYLYKNGNEYTNITGGWKFKFDADGSSSMERASAITGTDRITLSTNAFSQGYLSTANLIDLSDINTIKFSVSDVNVLGMNGSLCQVVICPSDYRWIYTPANYAALRNLSTGDSGLYGIDVSNLTGSYYIALHIAASYAGTNTFTVREVYGE